MSKYFLLVDDHHIVRTGIKAVLEGLYPTAFIHEAENGEEAEKKVKETHYHLLLLDLQMPRTDTLALISQWTMDFPDLPILVYSMSPENIYAIPAIQAGARGFLSKTAPLGELKIAFDRVLHHHTYISQQTAEQLAGRGDMKRSKTPFDLLSTRELEITHLLLKGEELREIGQSLQLHSSTASTYKLRIFEKLQVSNLFELAQLAEIYRFQKG